VHKGASSHAHPLASSIVSARSVVEVGPVLSLPRSLRMSLASMLMPAETSTFSALVNTFLIA